MGSLRWHRAAMVARFAPAALLTGVLACGGGGPATGTIPEAGFPCSAVPSKCGGDGGYFEFTSTSCPGLPETFCGDASTAYAVCQNGVYSGVACTEPHGDAH
jgi:hypothetical protein